MDIALDRLQPRERQPIVGIGATVSRPCRHVVDHGRRRRGPNYERLPPHAALLVTEVLRVQSRRNEHPSADSVGRCQWRRASCRGGGSWRVRDVRPLPNRAEVLPQCKSYPSATEASDHVAIWADLDLDDRPLPTAAAAA